jgi:hypothetical protein
MGLSDESSSDILGYQPPKGMGLCLKDTEPSAQGTTPFKRDATYYMEDGSCILLVEDTLFNVSPSFKIFEHT